MLYFTFSVVRKGHPCCYNRFVWRRRYGEAGVKGMGGAGAGGFSNPFDIFEQIFGSAGAPTSLWDLKALWGRLVAFLGNSRCLESLTNAQRLAE